MSLVVLPRPVDARTGAPAPVRPLEPGRSPRPHLRVVPDAAALRRHRRARALALLLGVAAAAGLMAIVALHVLLAQGQVRMERLERRAVAQEQRQRQLRLQVAALEAPQHVVAVARERLGMVPVDQVRYLTPPPPDPLPAAVELSGSRPE